MSKHSPSVHSSPSHILMSLLNPLSSILVSFSFLSISLSLLHVKNFIWHESGMTLLQVFTSVIVIPISDRKIPHSLTHTPSALWHEYFCTGRYRSLVDTSTSYITRCHIAPGTFGKNAASHWTTVAVEWAGVQVHSVPLLSSRTTTSPSSSQITMEWLDLPETPTWLQIPSAGE